MGKRLQASIWRKTFLRAVARTGNVRASAFEAGVDPGTAYDHRVKDAAFAARWAAELAKAKARPPSRKAMADKGQELVLRRTKHGDKLVRAGAGRWNAKAEADFFAELGRTGCVRAAAAACGFSTNALYARRDNYPEFAERWAAVEAQASERLPGLLRAASIASLDPEVTAKGLPRINVDQAIAISRLKGPATPVGTGPDGEVRSGRRGGILFRKPAMSREELQADLLKKLNVLGKRFRQQKLAMGWTESEEGHMIPPGWVRGEP